MLSSWVDWEPIVIYNNPQVNLTYMLYDITALSSYNLRTHFSASLSPTSDDHPCLKEYLFKCTEYNIFQPTCNETL